eukprot:1926340-Rhodomonas_salina.3
MKDAFKDSKGTGVIHRFRVTYASYVVFNDRGSWEVFECFTACYCTGTKPAHRVCSECWKVASVSLLACVVFGLPSSGLLCLRGGCAPGERHERRQGAGRHRHPRQGRQLLRQLDRRR